MEGKTIKGHRRIGNESLKEDRQRKQKGRKDDMSEQAVLCSSHYVIATDKVANILALQRSDAGDILVEDRQTAVSSLRADIKAKSSMQLL